MIEGIQAELVDILDLINSLWTYLSSSDEFTAHDDINDIVARTVSILKETNRDRNKFYLDEHKTLLSSVDKQKHLAVFYKNLDTTPFAAIGMERSPHAKGAMVWLIILRLRSAPTEGSPRQNEQYPGSQRGRRYGRSFGDRERRAKPAPL
jgi:hypothetical protein